MYLKLCVDWPHFGNILYQILSVVYNHPNPVSVLNKLITSLIDRPVPSNVIRQRMNDKAWFNEDCVNAYHNKQNAIVSGPRIDQTFCGRSVSCTGVMTSLSMMPHY